MSLFLPCRLPKSLKDKKVKIVFVVRNPKDAAVSLYTMMAGMKHYDYDGKFENWLPLYIKGGRKAFWLATFVLPSGLSKLLKTNWLKLKSRELSTKGATYSLYIIMQYYSVF